MARFRPILPLSVILVGLAFFLWVSFSTSPGASLAQPSCDDRPAYPGCIEIPVNCGAYPANVCDVTKTAIIATRTAAAAPVLTQTAQARGQQTQQDTATPTATLAFTDTPTVLPTTTTVAIATATPTLGRPVFTPQPTVIQFPASTPIPTLSPTVPLTPTPAMQSALRCAPGDVLVLTGETSPQTALLIFFDDRPVGGGASDRSGVFRLVLRIGDERPGKHEIIVRERERTTVVAEYVCETPPPPTLTPTFGPIRVTVTP